MLSGDIVFVLGDSSAHSARRDKEFLSGMKVRNPYSDFSSGLKMPNQELSEKALESVDDEMILKLIKKELAGTEKERKKAKLHQKQKQNLEQYKQTQEEGRKKLDGVDSKPEEMQRSMSDITKIVMLDKHGGSKKQIAVMEESKESSLVDEIRDESLPEEVDSEEDEKRMESSEDEKNYNLSNRVPKTPKVISPEGVERQSSRMEEEKMSNNDREKEIEAKTAEDRSNESPRGSMDFRRETITLQDEDEEDSDPYEDHNSIMDNENEFKMKLIDTNTNLLNFAKNNK